MTCTVRSTLPPRRGHRSVAAVVVGALGVLAACSSDDHVDETQSVAGAAAADPTSLQSLLATLPSPDRSDADPSFVEIIYGQLDVASDLVGEPRPTSFDGADVGHWLLSISGVPSGESPPAAVTLLPETVTPRSPDEIELADDELGWTVLDVSVFVALRHELDLVTVAAASVTPDDIDRAVGAASDGIWSVGEGDDYSVNVDERTAVRQLGQPLRMAWRDGLVAVGASTPAVQQWLAESSSLMTARPEIAAVSAALGSIVPYGAWIVAPDEPTRAYDAFGVAQSVVEGERIVVFAYHVTDPAEVDATVAGLEAALAGESARIAAPWSDLFDVESVAADGQIVTARLTLTDSTSASAPWRVIVAEDTLVTF